MVISFYCMATTIASILILPKTIHKIHNSTAFFHYCYPKKRKKTKYILLLFNSCGILTLISLDCLFKWLYYVACLVIGILVTSQGNMPMETSNPQLKTHPLFELLWRSSFFCGTPVVWCSKQDLFKMYNQGVWIYFDSPFTFVLS